MKDLAMTSQKMDEIPADYDLESYVFDLPEEQIAQYPLCQRQDSRLLVMDRGTGAIRHERFSHLARVLPEKSVLVTNVSKVIPARMQGHKRATQGRVEFLLLTPLPAIEVQDAGSGWKETQVQGLLRPAKGLKPGSQIDLPGGLGAEVSEVYQFGRCRIRIKWQGDLGQILLEHGNIPLPPYIRRRAGKEDTCRYQTVYAQDQKLGSVAAPTAGLHFSSEQIQDLKHRGHNFVELVLYVGYGTFTPIRVRDIRGHKMHAELMQVPPEAATELEQARYEGRPVVAVGTTAVRALETVWARFGRIQPYWGWTDLFLYPGSQFQVVDHMITNFHLPRSSLLLMVSAFAGRKEILTAYEQAVAHGYRFFSYGDAMFIR
ncbi:MAG: tRNA preQ1(34) S-adenosylmethionine ribosyltransferase-isomerase QueA [Desulfovermiculus sp.]